MIELSDDDRAAIEQIRRDWDRAYLSTSKLDVALFRGGLRAGLERAAMLAEEGWWTTREEDSCAAAIRALL